MSKLICTAVECYCGKHNLLRRNQKGENEMKLDTTKLRFTEEQMSRAQKDARKLGYAQAIEDAAKVSEAQKHFDDAGMIRGKEPRMKCAEIDEHKELHKALDRLVACFIEKTGRLPSKTTVMELIVWSHTQTLSRGSR